ncbi:MAG: hypothetical protein AAGE94_07680 [Acidobacteriota bacterium]
MPDPVVAPNRPRRRGLAGCAGFVGLIGLAIAKTLSRGGEPSALADGVMVVAILAALVAGLLVWADRRDRRRGSIASSGTPSATDAAQQSDAPPPIDDRWLVFDAWLGSDPSIDTSDGPLTVPRTTDVAIRVVGRQRDERDTLDFLQLETRIRDEDGSWWAARTFLQGDALVLPVLPDDDVGESVDRVEVCTWSEAPDAWRAAIESGCLVTDVTYLLDSRERYRLWVDERWWPLILKYQGPSVDLAVLDDELVARAKTMIFEDWDGDPWDSDPDAAAAAQCRDIVENVSIVYPLDPAHLLVVRHPELHRLTWEQCHLSSDDIAPDDRRPTFAASSEPTGPRARLA